jgi:aryl-alcohol dehydrogenase-like predicted oxidoreductase
VVRNFVTTAVEAFDSDVVHEHASAGLRRARGVTHSRRGLAPRVPFACGSPSWKSRLFQNQFNRGLLILENVLDACEAEDIGFMPRSPFGEGLREPAYELRWLLDRSSDARAFTKDGFGVTISRFR